MPYKPDHILISDTTESLFRDVANSITDYAIECINRHGRFNIALAGGSTPKQLYQTLASPPNLERIPWQHCHFYFGDERMVPHDNKQSNYLMARQSLFDSVPVPASNIHPIPTDCDHAEDCASQYEMEITRLDALDLVLLGMGDDGHTASLFPGTDILKEQDKLVAAVFVAAMDSWRISLTYPTLNQARRVIILVKGTDKQTMVNNVLYSRNASKYPVTGVRPAGELIWHMDSDAHPGDSQS